MAGGSFPAASGGLVASDFTFTKTEVTTTSQTDVDVLNKSAFLKMLALYYDDEDGSGNTSGADIKNIDNDTSMAGNIADSAIATNLEFGGNGGAIFHGVIVNLSGCFQANNLYAGPLFGVMIHNKFQFAVKSHSAPTTGIKSGVLYGDPPITRGHQIIQDDYKKRLVVENRLEKIDTSQLLNLLQAQFPNAVNVVRCTQIDKTTFHVDIENSKENQTINDLKVDALTLAKNHKYQKYLRKFAKHEIDDILADSLHPLSNKTRIELQAMLV